MKKMISFLALALSFNAVAEITSTATLTSDYVWRGLTQNSHESAVQGDFKYTHKSGFYGSIWATSLGGSESGHEVDTTIGYDYKIDDAHTIGLSYVDYTYTRKLSTNFQEVALNYSGKWFDLMYAVSQNYGGDDDNGEATYLNISRSFVCEKSNMALNLAYGMTTIGDDDKWTGGHTSYNDFKIGIAKTKGDFTTELFYTGTTGRETAAGVEYTEDSVVGFSLSTTL